MKFDRQTMIGKFDERSKTILPLQPPKAGVEKLKNPFQLVLQVIRFFLLLVPVAALSFIKDLSFKKPKSLDRKVVLVTGSGRGLGRGFALKFAHLGCKVACVDIDKKLNDETVQTIHEAYPDAAKAYVCNVAKSDDIRALKEAIVRDFGKVDLLVNNAGILAGSGITEFHDNYLHAIMMSNLTSHFFMIREFLPDMIKRNKGHIVAMASVSAFGGFAKGAIYVATKHAIAGLMECLYSELEEIPDNKVKTTLVCPYFVNTSTYYTEKWNLRVPEMSVSQAVDAAVDGILRDERIVTIPSYYYYVIHLCKLLPDSVTKMLKNIFYVRLTVPPVAEQKMTPVYELLKESMKNVNLGFKD